ncbi:8.6 kDa transglutaminase substrate-like [Haemaphysalis longicornis]
MRAFVLVALLVVLAALCVTATSPPVCGSCSQSQCHNNPETLNCSCGTHKDYCGCCVICNKCPGEECVPLFQHRCSEGHTCELDEPGTIHAGGKGKCKPSS